MPDLLASVACVEFTDTSAAVLNAPFVEDPAGATSVTGGTALVAPFVTVIVSGAFSETRFPWWGRSTGVFPPGTDVWNAER